MTNRFVRYEQKLSYGVIMLAVRPLIDTKMSMKAILRGDADIIQMTRMMILPSDARRRILFPSHPGAKKRNNMFTHESNDDLQSRRSVSSEAELTRTGKGEKYSRYFKTQANEDNNQLNHIFGENEHKEDVGIVFDNAQINILNNSWRSSDPSNITAYKEEYKLSFPVQEKSQSILKVPALDDLLFKLHCLAKDH